MDKLGLLIFQGVITLVVLVFMLLGLQATQKTVDRANTTLICVLSVPPDQRSPSTLEACK